MSIFWLWRTDLRFRNKTRYQRLLHIARRYKVVLVVPKSAYIRNEIKEVVTELVRCPFPFRSFLRHFALCLFGLFSFLKRFRKIKIIYSPPDYTVIWCALIKKLWPHFYWAADMWDDPRLYIYLRERNLIRKWSAKFFNWLVQRVLCQADLVITIGTDLNSNLPKIMVEEFGISPSKLLWVTNGVDLEMFSPSSNASKLHSKADFRLLYVGYIKEYLGIKVLLDAVERLVTYIPKINLTLVGFATSEDEAWLVRAISSCNLSNHVNFRGVVPSGQIPGVIEESHVCVYPFPRHKDLDNVYPIKVYEYLAMGKPVVATALSGVKTIIRHEYNGLIVEPENPESLKNAILLLYHDKSLYNRISENARTSVEKYSWDAVNENVIQRVSLLLAAGPGCSK